MADLEQIQQWLSDGARVVTERVSPVTGALAVGATTLFAIWIWRSRRRMRELKRLGIPGPTPGFMMGNMDTMGQMGMMGALQFWRDKYGDVYGFYAGKDPVLVVCDFDLLRDLMVKRFASFPNRITNAFIDYRPWNQNLTHLRDDHWKHVRKHLSPVFSSGKLKRMCVTIEKVTLNFLKHLRAEAERGNPVELKGMCGSFATDVIAALAFGLDVDSIDNPDNEFSKQCVNLVDSRRWLVGFLFALPFMIPILRAVGITIPPQPTVRFFVNVVENSIKERRQENAQYSDFLQLLVEAEKAGEAQGPVDAEIDHEEQLATSAKWTRRKGLTLDEMTGNSLIFLFAANETVVMGMSFTLFSLAANPDYLAKAQDEIDTKIGKRRVDYEGANQLTYLDMCVNEGLRLYGPAFQVDRQTAEDLEFAGYHLPKGFSIWIPICLVHRDPKAWPDPLKFDPERHTPEARAARHPFAFMPFGLGPRNCIGMRLAQLEIRMALATILQKFTPVLCEKSVYPPRISKFRMFAEDGLWVKLQPRD